MTNKMTNKIEKQIQYKNKTYTFICTLDKQYSCFCKEITTILFTANTEEEIMFKGEIMLRSYFKHMSRWGIKNLKTKTFDFSTKKYNFRLCFMTPYQSKYWLWYFHRSKINFSYTIRFLGMNIHLSKKGSLDKFLNKIK